MTGKKLRFASLIRVSTEKQEQQGESLLTQADGNKSAIAAMGGVLVETYGGQEHATPGFERRELDRLLQDAQIGQFDAVIVAYFDRWSRDNVKAEQGLQVLRDNNIRFFVGQLETDLFDPTQGLALGLQALLGQYNTLDRIKKSTESRIARAKRGIPTSGRLPFGRTFDRQTDKWGVDPNKAHMIADAAKRYLAGESMAQLAKEHGINHATLNKTLRERCGTEWQERFRVKRLKIDETVTHTVPALLPEQTIAAIRRKQASARTYHHGQEAQEMYLLAGKVFCSQCGYTMSGQTNHRGKKYYRHKTKGLLKNDCPGPHSYIDAYLLEQNVLYDLFTTLGDPGRVVQSIAAATPNQDQAAKLERELAEADKRIKQTKRQKERLIDHIQNGTLDREEVTSRLDKLREQLDQQQRRVELIKQQLGSRPTKGQYSVFSGIATVRQEQMRDYRNWKWAKLRQLVQVLFDGTMYDGRPLGVYMAWNENRAWCYRIAGHLAGQGGLLEHPSSPMGVEDLNELQDFTRGWPPKSDTGLVMQCASRSPAPSPPARRTRGRTARRRR